MLAMADEASGMETFRKECMESLRDYVMMLGLFIATCSCSALVVLGGTAIFREITMVDWIIVSLVGVVLPFVSTSIVFMIGFAVLCAKSKCTRYRRM
jgi:hypothetical protein